MCSQTSIKKTRNVKHTGLSLQRGSYITCLPPRMLGVDVVNSLMISVLCVVCGQATLAPKPLLT